MGTVSGRLCGSRSAPCSQLPISCHFLIFPTVVASVFSSLLSLSVSVFLSFSSLLEALSAFLASLRSASPSPSPHPAPRPSHNLEAQGLEFGGLPAWARGPSGRQWCRRPLELRPSRGPEQSQRGLKPPPDPNPKSRPGNAMPPPLTGGQARCCQQSAGQVRAGDVD